jgi:hypothetical protein
MKSKSKRSSPSKVKYPRSFVNTKKYPLDATGYYTNAPGFAKQPHPPFHFVLTGFDQVTQGKSPDNWRHLIATIQSATSAHNGRLTQCKPISGSSQYNYIDKSTDVITGVIDQSCMSITDPDNAFAANVAADNLAKARLHKSVYRIQNTWRGGNFIAELRETINALKHPLRSIYHRTYSYAGKVRTLGKVYRADPHRYGKELANAWLAYVFGIRPLANDVADLSVALHKLGTSRFDRTKLYGSGHVSTSNLTVPGVSWTVSGHPQFPGQVQDRVEVQDFFVRYKGAIRTRPLDSNLVIQQFGIGFNDIVPAVWEAIPWSFFIDYFVNVQEVLDGMRLIDVDVAWLVRLLRNERKVDTSHVYGSPSLGTTKWLHSGGGGQTLCRTHSRTALTTIPYPSWQFRIPGLTSLKWLNIAALSQQIRSSKPIPFVQYKAPRRR